MVSVTVSVRSLYGLCTETKRLKAETTVSVKRLGFPSGLCYGGLCTISVLPCAPHRRVHKAIAQGSERPLLALNHNLTN